MSTVPSSGSGQCRTCGGLALYQPVPEGPWWTHDDSAVDHRVVIDPDTTSYGPDGVRLPSAESTSATLRRVEQERDDLAAKFDARGKQFADMFNQLNQANMELDRVCAERDEARAGLSNALHCFDDLQSVAGRKYQELEGERDEALAQLAKPCGECHPCEQYAPLQDAQRIADTNDLLRVELASALTELDAVRAARDNLDRARNWVVARDDGYTCDWCGQGIHRGEAYEHTHGADEYRHIHCPTEPGSHHQ